MKTIAINTKTQEEYNFLVNNYFADMGKKFPRSGNNWTEYKERTCICATTVLSYANIEYIERNSHAYTIVTFEQFFAVLGIEPYINSIELQDSSLVVQFNSLKDVIYIKEPNGVLIVSLSPSDLDSINSLIK